MAAPPNRREYLSRVWNDVQNSAKLEERKTFRTEGILYANIVKDKGPCTDIIGQYSHVTGVQDTWVGGKR